MSDAATQTLPSVITVNLQANSMADIMEIAKVTASSGMVPKEYAGRPEAVVTGLLFAKELGLPCPLLALSNIAVINGRPTMWGDLVLAMVRGSGTLEEFEEYWELDGKVLDMADADAAIRAGHNVKAVCQAKRVGEKKTLPGTFSMAMAKEKGYMSRDTYKADPARMIQMRARGFKFRDTFADVLRGLYLREEMEGEVIEMQTTGAGQFAPQEDAPKPSSLADKMKKPMAATTVEVHEEAKAEPEKKPKKGKTDTKAPSGDTKEAGPEPKKAEAEPDKPKTPTHQRGTIKSLVEKDTPEPHCDVVLINRLGQSVNVVFRGSCVDMGFANYAVADGKDIFYFWKQETENGRKAYVIFDVIPAELYEDIMKDRARKEAEDEAAKAFDLDANP